MHHIVQDNLFREHNFKKLIAALERQSLPYTVVRVVPSSNEILPDVHPDGLVMVWGAIALGNIVSDRGWKPGRFHNDNFDMRVLHEKYGSHMLNTDAVFCEFGQTPEFEGLRFVRPVHDNKLFTGSVLSWKAIQEAQARILSGADESERLKLKLPVMLSSVKNVKLEARFFVVAGRVITGSTYSIFGERYCQEVQQCPMALPL